MPLRLRAEEGPVYEVLSATLVKRRPEKKESRPWWADMNHSVKLRTAERTLFVLLTCAIAGGAFVYEYTKNANNDWKLVGLVVAYLLLCFACYRAALNYFVKRYEKDI